MNLKTRAFFLALLVVGISAFTHFYRINQTFVFQNDEGRDALIAFRMIETQRPVLLGPETSVGNMYLGPFYYYLMAPALWMSSLDPVGPAIMVAVLAVATTLALIYLGKKYLSWGAGLIAGLFYALSPVMLYYSRSSWNPNVIPFFISLMLLAYPLTRRWHAVVFGMLTGIIFQLHYVALLVPAILIMLELYKTWGTKEWRSFWRNTALIVLGALITSAPFWLFEVRHAFVNSQAFLTYLMTRSTSGDLGYPPYFTRLADNARLLVDGLIGSRPNMLTPVSWITTISALITLVLYGVGRRGVLTALTIVSLIVISVLKENIHVHYLAFLFPVICLIIGISLAQKQVLLKVAALVLTLSLLMPTWSSLRYNLGELTSTQPRRAKETATYITDHAQGRPYNVVNASSGSNATILYYLSISENPPKTTMEPLLFVICEQTVCPEEVTTNTQLFLNGPSHPSIIEYLGYTPALVSPEKRTITRNEWVTYDVNVATVTR